MTEAQWLASADVFGMWESVRGRVSERKARLFACACCRRLWGNSADPPTRAALEIAEHLAEGARPLTWRARVRLATGQAVIDCGASDPVGPFLVPGPDGFHRQVERGSVRPLLLSVLEHLACANSAPVVSLPLLEALNQAGLDPARQAELLRDIVRGPFRPLYFRNAWLRWNDGLLRKLARGIYDDWRFGDLPILADALEEAGCADEEVLAHCRSAGEHVRGCWVVDLLSGRG